VTGGQRAGGRRGGADAAGETLEGLNPEDGMEEARRIVELSSVARDV
jgi:hypothetical protein